MTQGVSYAFVASRQTQVETFYLSSCPNKRQLKIRQKSEGVHERSKDAFYKLSKLLSYSTFFLLNEEMCAEPLFHT